ncbi:hypothetical protein [Clostridium tarantellae]|uniref:Uncharacterized protein n=1 Tax=Clostridium tarantellae TaxID=39493 RepID=A0A6I1MFI7_9CLOT|nr:hypothetical protein [Clostridium tarantellae]MPQ42256.1 hypothetical protein [Clostridium tarantellae]
MKKIIFTIPFILFSIIFFWGYVNINIENTKVFNNKDLEVSNVDSEKLKEETGMDLSMFSKDESKIKIYREDEEVYAVIDNYKVDINKGIIGKGLVNLIDSINHFIDKISTFVEIVMAS